jgi:ABC-type branched-subunit amino acid transport system ATPase component
MKYSEFKTQEAELLNISNVNIILGRNGAGKSLFLRALDVSLSGDPNYNVRYISPERAGVFRKDGNVQTNIENNITWLRDTRRRNQADNFKAASAYLLREIEVSYLRRLQDSISIRQDLQRNFRVDRLDGINRLLSNISIEQVDSNFVFINSLGESVPPEQISSGESEAIALASEIMYFFETLDGSKFNILLLDEPDVHLHPDLQARLAKFILKEITGLPDELRPNVAICLATHSTPFVCALAESAYTSIGTKDFGVKEVQQKAAPQQIKKVAPFFGHPLSLSLSNDVMLLLEGEDDERVWQQAARSSQGRIRLFPVLATSVDQQFELEEFCAELLKSLYDDPRAYSLRDGDGKTGELPPIGPVFRFRLNCYAIENTLVSDECLQVLHRTWADFQISATSWLKENPDHRDKGLIEKLIVSEDRMRQQKIKQIRQLICSIADSKKPWEVVVGQAIGSLNISSLPTGSDTLASFIGIDAVQVLLTPSITY